MIDTVIIIAIDHNVGGHGVIDFHKGVEVLVKPMTGQEQSCGSLADYNTYKELSCKKVGSTVIFKRPGSNKVLTMGGIGVLADCECSGSSLNPALFATQVAFVSLTTINK